MCDNGESNNSKPSIIFKSTYYIVDKPSPRKPQSCAGFFGNEGNFLKCVNLLPTEAYYLKHDRLKNMLDPGEIKQVKIVNITIRYGYLLLYDVNNHQIAKLKHNGELNKNKIIKHHFEKLKEYGIDIRHLQTTNIKIFNYDSNDLCCIL